MVILIVIVGGMFCQINRALGQQRVNVLFIDLTLYKLIDIHYNLQ